MDDVIQLAVQTHRGKKDKAGHPYILHVIRVMFKMKSEEEKIVGVLHDVVEESSVTLDRLKDLGYSDQIVQAIDYLTWRKDQESYEQYVRRLKSDSLAVAVKRADLADHLVPSIDGGSTWLEKNYPELYERYRKALIEVGCCKVLGRDGFDVEAGMYPLGEYSSEFEALEAAYKRLEELEETRPSSNSGGQNPNGIQDRVYVETPDGKVKRIMPQLKK